MYDGHCYGELYNCIKEYVSTSIIGQCHIIIIIYTSEYTVYTIKTTIRLKVEYNWGERERAPPLCVQCASFWGERERAPPLCVQCASFVCTPAGARWPVSCQAGSRIYRISNVLYLTRVFRSWISRRALYTSSGPAGLGWAGLGAGPWHGMGAAIAPRVHAGLDCERRGRAARMDTEQRLQARRQGERDQRRRRRAAETDERREARLQRERDQRRRRRAAETDERREARLQRERDQQRSRLCVTDTLELLDKFTFLCHLQLDRLSM